MVNLRPSQGLQLLSPALEVRVNSSSSHVPSLDSKTRSLSLSRSLDSLPPVTEYTSPANLRLHFPFTFRYPAAIQSAISFKKANRHEYGRASQHRTSRASASISVVLSAYQFLMICYSFSAVQSN
ncbi:hypothetical protein LXL04_001604 [Taraxacum kok-saghyz]